jgi:hypothetical protein
MQVKTVNFETIDSVYWEGFLTTISKLKKVLSMTKQKAHLTKIEKYATKCKDQYLVDAYVARYMQQTKNAVENLISMSEIVFEMNSKVETGKLNESDLNYFCSSVGLNKQSSYFRKHVCIGKKADFLRKFIDKIPSAVTTVYQITTIDPKRIERFIDTGILKPNTTLSELKGLIFANENNQDSKKINKAIENIRIEYYSEKLDTNAKKKLLEIIKMIKNLLNVSVVFPQEKDFEYELNNVIDAEMKMLKYA